MAGDMPATAPTKRAAAEAVFSLSVLAAGLEQALPADSPVRSAVETLAETVQGTNREMRRAAAGAETYNA